MFRLEGVNHRIILIENLPFNLYPVPVGSQCLKGHTAGDSFHPTAPFGQKGHIKHGQRVGCRSAIVFRTLLLTLLSGADSAPYHMFGHSNPCLLPLLGSGIQIFDSSFLPHRKNTIKSIGRVKMVRPLGISPQLKESITGLVLRQDEGAKGGSILQLQHQILHNLELRADQIYIEPSAVGSGFERLVVKHPTRKPDGIAGRIDLAVSKEMNLFRRVAHLPLHLLRKEPGKSSGKSGYLLGCGKRREDP